MFTVRRTIMSLFHFFPVELISAME
jgi:hypothetical protein